MFDYPYAIKQKLNKLPEKFTALINLLGSHGRMSETSQQTVVVGKRMSKPYVPYGIKRYRRIG